MIIVTPRHGESTSNLIRRFMRKTEEDGILYEVCDRRFYKKPSEIRKEKRLRKPGARRF